MEQGTETPLSPKASAQTVEDENSARRRLRFKRAASGFVFGVLTGFAASELNLDTLLRVDETLTLWAGLVGSMLALTRWRKGLTWFAGVVAVCLLVVCYTPVTSAMMPGLSRIDRPEKAPAIVVLSFNVLGDGRLSSRAQERLIHAYELLGQDYATTLVLTRTAANDQRFYPIAEQQLRQLGIESRIIETAGIVRNTHDETVEVAQLARQQGWDQVILVTHPWHMRRAAALFDKVGIRVICSPCTEGMYEFEAPSDPGGRLKAFRDWVRETVGFFAYRARGWV